ncbi:CBS domain-containing protein [Bacillus sp. SCS-153A]|uniref:CBS domain-containing protein n=1 Tax=Rossellomorea sedimentorum TaxID=3115294 RepID=UPI0039067C15
MKLADQLIRSERFEVAYNRVDEVLRKWVDYYDKRFTVLVREGAKHHHLIKLYKDELEQYGRLRNAIVHEKKELGTYIAEPHLEVVERLERIAAIFTQPNYALTIATKSVVWFDYEASIVPVIKAIKEHGYSQYPIYNDKTFAGLLTTGDILKWMADYTVNGILELTEIKVMDILSGVESHPIEFAKKSLDIFEVEEIFENAHRDKTDLEAIIITENGRKDETPLGLITAWDLIEIDYTAD